MARRKRSKQRTVIGNRMKIPADAPKSVPEGTLRTFRSEEKAALFEDLAQALGGNDPSPVLTDEDALAPDEAALEDNAGQLKLLADVATGLWRLRLKMLPAGTTQPSEENRRSYKQLEAIFQTLTQARVEIRDHTGEVVPRGGIYTLNVLAYEPAPGIAREQVIETIKPTIYLRGRPIQVGEVIVGTPEIS